MLRDRFEIWMNGKLLHVRPAMESEFADVVALRAHPAVGPFQYDPGPFHEAALRQHYELQREHPGLQYCLYSISLDHRFIGSLICVRYLRPRVIADGPIGAGLPIIAGWDLHPDVWGNGYMSTALSIVFSRMFEMDEDALIRCECFSINERCIRLLDRLGFERRRMPWMAKMAIKINQLDFHKHLRFELTKPLLEGRTLHSVGDARTNENTTTR